MHEYVEAWKFIAVGGSTAFLFAWVGGLIAFFSSEGAERVHNMGIGVLIGAIVGAIFGPSILAALA